MIAASVPTFGIVGALAAFPRRLAAREVERLGGHLHRGVTRLTTHVVFGLSLLGRMTGEDIAVRVDAERAAGRHVLGETAFLRHLGLAAAPLASGLTRASLVGQAGLAPGDLDLLALFDAFEHDGEPFSFRDLILARKYAGLVAGGAGWHSIARSVHRSGPTVSLTAKALQVGGGQRIHARYGDGFGELDGQLLFDLGAPDEDPDDLFAAAEAAEADARPADAAALYARCLALDPGDVTAAFNRGNALRAAGRADDAVRDYTRALRHDPGFVEAWFNLAGLMTEQQRPDAARCHLLAALACDPGYADAVFNLAALEFEAGDLAAARRWWERYLELDPTSEWARTAARGVRYVALRSSAGHAG